MKKEWKHIPYEGLRLNYIASNAGDVCSIRYCGGEQVIHQMKPNKRGYIWFMAYDGCAMIERVNRIIYLTFNGRIPKKYKVVPRNGDWNDMRAENLVLERKSGVIAAKRVIQRRGDGEIICIHDSMKDAAEANGISINVVRKRLYYPNKRMAKNAYMGLYFEFAKEEDNADSLYSGCDARAAGVQP